MLVLSRHENEQIIFGNDLARVLVVDIRGDKVRLGIEAPKGIAVHRLEVFEAIQREQGGPLSVPTSYIMSPRDLVLQFASHEQLMQAAAGGVVQFTRPSESDDRLAKGA